MIVSCAAHAQHREFARERFHTPHWVFDDLPPAYATVWLGGAPYYYANDVYYSAAPGGYVVADPPAGQALAPASGPEAPNWYYCDSAKAYYPYVAECKEGWRQVPATPPR